MKTIDASKLRGSFARMLEGVRYRGEEVLITRYGRPVAVLARIERLSAAEQETIRRRFPRGPAARPR